MEKRTENELIWKECQGEAHSNPFIDNCMECLPYWHHYPTCPDCGWKVRQTAKMYICDRCHSRYFKFPRPQEKGRQGFTFLTLDKELTHPEE